MKITREVSFSWDEVQEIAKQAILERAIKAIGTINTHEKYNVYLSIYGTAEVSIVPIPPVVLCEKKMEKADIWKIGEQGKAVRGE
jgi:hypothetical protein